MRPDVAELAAVEVAESLLDSGPGVHHERPAKGRRFAD
jgi:hypothetical protein